MQVVIQADPLKKRKQLCILFVFPYLLSLITLFKCRLAPFKALQANDFFVGFCPNSKLFRPVGKVRATSATFVTKLILAAKAAFIRKSVCFEVFKILFGQLVERMLENKSLHEREALPLAGECASGVYFWPCLNGPLPAKLKFRENTVQVLENY